MIAAVASGVIMIFTYLMSSLASLLPSGHTFSFWFLAVLAAALAFGLHMWIHNGWMAALIGLIAEIALTVTFILNTEAFDGILRKSLEAVSIIERYDNFTLGIFDVSALIYYLSVCFLFVFITIQRIRKKRWS